MAKRTATQTVNPLTTKDALKERFKDFPSIDVLDRRMLDPHDPGSLPILFKDDPDPCCGDIGHAYKAKPGALKCPTCKVPFVKWYKRWINAGEPERWSTVRARGFVKAQKKQLRDADDVPGMSDAAENDYVTRGDRKQEVLAYLPFPYFIEIKREKQRQYEARQNPKKMKAEITEEAGRDSRYGDEGASALHDSLKVEEFKRHKTTLGEELGVE